MTQHIEVKKETLAQRGKRWGAAMRSGQQHPLIVAKEVLEAIDNWELYQAEADGLSANAWLSANVGSGLTRVYWERRAQAVDILGEASRRTLDHEAAVWLAHTVPTDKRQACFEVLMFAARESSGALPNVEQAQRRCRDILGRTRNKRKVCARCEKLREQLRAAGVEPTA